MRKRIKNCFIIVAVIATALILFLIACKLLNINLGKFFSNETTVLVLFVVVVMSICLGLSMINRDMD